MRARTLRILLLSTLFSLTASAQDFAFPAGFKTQLIATNGTSISVRVGGQGPPVLLIHGYGDTGDMWIPLATDLAKDHTVIVPDLRGMGLSAVETTGFTKKNQATDLAGVLDVLKVGNIDVVGHDIGNMVAFAFAAMYRDRTTRLVMMDAPVPGIGPWDELLKNPILWHFRFGGKDMVRLVAGRERIYLDRFWNDFSANPKQFPEADRAHYAALYARPGRMHAGFSQFAAFDQDAVDNRELMTQGRMKLPVLAIGGAKSFGPVMAQVMRFAADDVTEVTVSGSGHWLMEEQPKATVAAIRKFFDETALPQRRLTLAQVEELSRSAGGAGTSGLAGVQTTVLSGDPSKPGPYAFEIRVPANTKIAAHLHRDDRNAIVVSGEWHFGYGNEASDAAAITLGPGAFYTEPAGVNHFAFTGDKPAVVYITGIGPTNTNYVKQENKE